MRSIDRTPTLLPALPGLMLLALGALVAQPAQAQSAPVGLGAANPKPLVMLLVDTSGSMERMPNTDTRVDALPDCSADEKNRWAITLESLTGTFNGFSCTREDRGTYSTSAYDYGYFLPHHRPSFTSQTPTGILDTYAERAKFGLMTFDPIGTYVSGPFFVSHASLSTDPANHGASGMYSYGEVRELAFPGCDALYGVDNGARNQDAPSGALISPGGSEDSPDVLAVNQAIQEALLGTSPLFDDGVRPFGGTPVAGMLDDLEYFFDNDGELSISNDPYATCRPRTAILITDGVPDSDYRDPRFDCDIGTAQDQDDDDPAADPTCAAAGAGGCRCPYDLPEQYIARLCEKDAEGNCSEDAVLNRGFHVVALSLSSDEAAVTELNALAEEGGTAQAYLADDSSALDAALSEILDNASTEATTRVAPVVKVSDLGKLYELTAGFAIPEDGGTWTGVLQRRRWECDGLVPTRQELENAPGTDSVKDILHAHLDDNMAPGDRSVRVLAVPHDNAYDIIRSPDLDTDAYNGTTLNLNSVVSALDDPDDGSGFSGFGADPQPPTTATMTVLDGSTNLASSLLSAVGGTTRGRNLDLSLLGDLDGDGSTDEADAEYAYAWLLGEESTGRESRMGAVYHSQPVVIAPPEPDTANDALNDFYEALALQPEVAVVATGDGLLRAFSLEENVFDEVEASTVEPQEDAFGLDSGDLAVPGPINPGDELWAIAPPAALASLADAASGTQLLFDGSPVVRTIATDRAEGSESPASYRRILIAALRGLPAYVAFDITNVAKPKFMWQYTHEKMGETLGRPVVAQLAIAWNGDDDPSERAIALLPGGTGETESTCDGGGVVGSRRSDGTEFPSGLPRRDPSDPDAFRCWRQQGRYLYAVDVLTGSLVQYFDYSTFAAPLTGALAVDVDGLGLTATAGYITDADGILYRIDLADSNPQNWEVEAIYDPFHAGPGPGGTTGGRPSYYPPVIRQTESGEQILVLATGDVDNLTDSIAHRVASITETRLFDDPSGRNVQIEENWSIVLDDSESVTGPLAYFDEGVYFASFQANDDPGNLCSVGSSRIWGVEYLEDDGGDPVGKLPNLDDADDDPVTFYDSGDIPELGENLLVGLSVVQQPTCVPGDFEQDPYLGDRYVPSGAVGGGAYSLRAVMNGGGGTQSTDSPFSQIDVEITQPTTPVQRVTGGFGSVLE